MSAWVEESAVSEHGAGDAEESVDDLSECSSVCLALCFHGAEPTC